MVGIVFVGIVVSAFLLIWTKFNINEHKSIGTRWEELIAKEEERENNFKKIKSVVVTLCDGTSDEVRGVLLYTWDKDEGRLTLYNAEEKAVSIYQLSEITGVHFIREGDKE